MAEATNKKDFIDIAEQIGTPGFFLFMLAMFSRECHKVVDGGPFTFDIDLCNKSLQEERTAAAL